MKLIIDIPKKNFIKDDLIHFFGCYSQKLDEVIKNGTPLDKLRAEIEEQIVPRSVYTDKQKKQILAIIDNYRGDADEMS
jgi:replication initiation and membrane attachment protein DnaB